MRKRRDLTQSYDKSPTPAEITKGQSDNTNNATKSSITQRLRTDLGWLVGVTTATQLVWLCPIFSNDLIDMFNDTSQYLNDISTIDNPEFEKYIPRYISRRTSSKKQMLQNIVAAFRGMHVSPAKHSYA